MNLESLRGWHPDYRSPDETGKGCRRVTRQQEVNNENPIFSIMEGMGMYLCISECNLNQIPVVVTYDRKYYTSMALFERIG